MMFKKKIRDPEATRKALLDAAESVFLTKGFGNTATSEIAKEAGLTKSLIHHYFGSKDGLWKEVKFRRFNVYFEKQMEILASKAPSLSLILESMGVYFQFLKKNPELIRILSWIHLERDPETCTNKDNELIETGILLIKQIQKKGEIRSDIEPHYILFAFISLCQFWFQDRDHFIQNLDDQDDATDFDEAYLDAIVKIFKSGIVAPAK